MEELMVIIDAGHGVDTRGKRSLKVAGETQLFEWEFNRIIANKLCRRLYEEGIHFHYIPTVYDTLLDERTSEANKAYNKNKANYKSVFVSIHGNAAAREGANGVEVFTYIGDSPADDLAESVLISYQGTDTVFLRTDCSDGDLDKEARFVVLRDTIPPAILVELGFYTNDKERLLMLNNEWQEEMVDLLVKGLLDYYYNI